DARDTRRMSTVRESSKPQVPSTREAPSSKTPNPVRYLMFRPEQDRFFVRSLHLDAVRLDVGIVLERLVNDAAVESGQRFQLHHVTPAPDFFGGFFGLLNQRLPRLGAVPADVDHDLRRRRVLLKEQAVGDVLQV